MSKQLRINGFTLIELLAVIVIIAIIAVITTPIISDVLKGANEDTFLDTARSINRAANNYYAESVTSNYSELLVTYENGQIISSKRKNSQGVIEETTENYLDYTGKHPDSGQVYISAKGEVSMAIYDDKSDKCALKNGTYKQPTIPENENEQKSKEECILNISME